jgi:hypothetical protein
MNNQISDLKWSVRQQDYTARYIQVSAIYGDNI